jgi:hypothetical protein
VTGYGGIKMTKQNNILIKLIGKRVIVEFSRKRVYSSKIEGCDKNLVSLVNNWELGEVSTTFWVCSALEYVENSTETEKHKKIYKQFIRTLLNPTVKNISEYQTRMRRRDKDFDRSRDVIPTPDGYIIYIKEAPSVVKQIKDIKQIYTG